MVIKENWIATVRSESSVLALLMKRVMDEYVEGRCEEWPMRYYQGRCAAVETALDAAYDDALAHDDDDDGQALTCALADSLWLAKRDLDRAVRHMDEHLDSLTKGDIAYWSGYIHQLESLIDGLHNCRTRESR